MVESRTLVLLGLVALVPVALLILELNAVAFGLSLVSVLLIVGSLYIAFGGTEEPTPHDHA